MHANVWKDNPVFEKDAVLLERSGADIIGLNEAAGFSTELAALAGYQWTDAGSRLFRQDPVLVKDSITLDGYEFRKMCDAVGISAARGASVAKYRRGKKKRAHLSTHTNAHIQLSPNEPQNLPRVKEDIRHVVRMEEWVRELDAEGYEVTVSGDFNWSWSEDDTHDWTYSPEAVFARLGMVTQFDHPTWPGGGTLGSRGIDYFAYRERDLTITGQSIVKGEHSDHRWILVETEQH